VLVTVALGIVDVIEMEPGVPREALVTVVVGAADEIEMEPGVPREALVIVVLGIADEIEMEPGIPGMPKVPREALATVVPGTANSPENCKLLDLPTPRKDKVAGFYGSIRYKWKTMKCRV
jgi:hypothetical protein